MSTKYYDLIKKPTYKLKTLVKRKREFLGLPTGKINSRGGRDAPRELIRMRDKHTCQICKKVWKEGERRFDVHHKDLESSKTRQVDSFKEFNNLVTLCHRCHIRLHKMLKKSYQHFF